MTGMDGIQDRPLPHHRAPTHPGALGDHAATADHDVVLDDDRSGLGRLENTADADPAREVHLLTDLGARADGGPRVDHGARPHPGADVDVAGHADHPGAQVRAPARRCPGDHPHTARLVVALQRQLVGELEGADLHRLHRPQSEQQEDGVLEPLVDDHLVGGRIDLGDAGFPRVEQVDGGGHDLEGVRVAGREPGGPLPQRLDPVRQIGVDGVGCVARGGGCVLRRCVVGHGRRRYRPTRWGLDAGTATAGTSSRPGACRPVSRGRRDVPPPAPAGPGAGPRPPARARCRPVRRVHPD